MMILKKRSTWVLFSLLLVLVFSTGCRSLFNKSSSAGDLKVANSNAGIDRQHLVPLGSQISVPGWQIGVVQFLRGDEALKIVNDTDWPPPPLPEGQEYALVKVFLRSTYLGEDYQYLGISELHIIDDQDQVYGDTLDGWPQPEFLYEDMYTAETVEGWVDAVVPVDVKNLVMVLDYTTDDGIRVTRYFKLE
jgi:hypothetical protein